MPLVALLGVAVAAALAWWARGWWCRRANPNCPVWAQERKLIWKAKLRKQYPNGSHERRPTPAPTPAPAPTPGAVPMARLDNEWRAGIPSQRMDTPTTGVANPKRKT